MQILIKAHKKKMDGDTRWESDANSIKNMLLQKIRKGSDDTKNV